MEEKESSDKPEQFEPAPEIKEAPKNKASGINIPARAWLMTVIISLLMSALSIFVYDRFFIQKIVAIDIKGYIAEQRDLFLAGKINDEQFKANIDKLEAAVKNMPDNKVLIMGDAVVKNAEVIKP